MSSDFIVSRARRNFNNFAYFFLFSDVDNAAAGITYIGENLSGETASSQARGKDLKSFFYYFTIKGTSFFYHNLIMPYLNVNYKLLISNIQL